MISIRLSVRPEIWINVEVWKGKVYRVIPSRRPLGVEGDERWATYIKGLVSGAITYKDVPHVEIKELDGRILKWLAENVPRGMVTTYKAVASVFRVHPRNIGHIMRRNKLPIIYPCHRVIMSDGSLGGYVDPEIKAWILRLEGVRMVKGRIDSRYIIRRF